MRFFVPALPLIALINLAIPAPAMAAKAADAPAKNPEQNTYELLNLFGEVFDRVRTDYVEPVEDSKLIESALNGMLTALDPHSNYMNEKSFADMRIQTKGEFGGLGIEVTMENGLVRVMSPIDDTPAARAGIKPGDLIAEIDGTAVMGMTLSDAVEKMRGPIGTTVKITVLRSGAKAPMPIAIKRDLIKIQSVRSRPEGDVAYLRITSFAETTADMLKAAFEKEKKTIGANLKGVVLDLRNNPGGLLDQAVAVADAFLNQGEIVSTRSRKTEETRRFSASTGDITGGLPVVVLINEGSASASEIVAGALKDHKRAVVMGIKSFGKGSVQTVIPIESHGAIRLTTARYYTPSGVSIQAKGITPDIVVEQAKVEPLKAGLSFSEASLSGHLEGDSSGDSTGEAGLGNYPSLPVKKDEKKDLKKDTAKDTKKDTTKDSALTEKEKKEAKEREEDYQLNRALDLIQALAIYKPGTQAAPVASDEATTAPLATPAASTPVIPFKKRSAPEKNDKR